MITTIFPNKLYISDAYTAADVLTLEENKITTILNLGSRLKPIVDGYETIDIYLHDGHGNDYAQFKRAVEMLTELLDNNKVVLVHCHAGISRSPTVVATHLAKTLRLSFDKACDIIALVRPQIDPNTALRKLGRIFLGEVRENE